MSNLSVVYQFKDTIFWKQITTYWFIPPNKKRLFISSKIQFSESKSQLINITFKILWVVYQFKDTIFWKQITTDSDFVTAAGALFISSKIQFSESKSQLSGKCTAILQVVYQFKDTIFWKLFTTSSVNQLVT